uniref:Uncharacterized protein n=1 Tax=Caulerpa verticillata TaxID=177082 RepID=A0A386B0C6_9CHLO|nr:hypothetical protein [Caulerpa verticillata]AYC65156.1 hypothetical protein [Caulerpa verticillata]
MDIWDDTETIRQELNHYQKYLFSIPSTTIIKDCFVPRFYWNTKIEEARRKAKKMKMYLISLRELLEKNILVSYKGHGSPPSQNKGQGLVSPSETLENLI